MRCPKAALCGPRIFARQGKPSPRCELPQHAPQHDIQMTSRASLSRLSPRQDKMSVHIQLCGFDWSSLRFPPVSSPGSGLEPMQHTLICCRPYASLRECRHPKGCRAAALCPPCAETACCRDHFIWKHLAQQTATAVYSVGWTETGSMSLRLTIDLSSCSMPKAVTQKTWLEKTPSNLHSCARALTNSGQR